MNTPLVSDHTVIYCTQYSILVVKRVNVQYVLLRHWQQWSSATCNSCLLFRVALKEIQVKYFGQHVSYEPDTYKTWSKGENAALQVFKKPLNTLYKEEVPLELWVCWWFTLWTEQCKQQEPRPFLCFYKTIAVSSCLPWSPNSGYAARNDIISLTVAPLWPLLVDILFTSSFFIKAKWHKSHGIIDHSEMSFWNRALVLSLRRECGDKSLFPKSQTAPHSPDVSWENVQDVLLFGEVSWGFAAASVTAGLG